MSHQAIAAALVRDDLCVGERLVAFALASFADRDHLARPGTSAAAERAGLSKSRFLEARDGLVRCGLLVVELPATGRGRACTLGLPFACEGPWWDGEINAELFEAVLGYSRAQGSARLLVAAMAALADERRVVEGFTIAELCSASGITERTYGRVRGPLLALGELDPSHGVRSGEHELLGDLGPAGRRRRRCAHASPSCEPAGGRAAAGRECAPASCGRRGGRRPGGEAILRRGRPREPGRGR